jgi:hypothetical protein
VRWTQAQVTGGAARDVPGKCNSKLLAIAYGTKVLLRLFLPAPGGGFICGSRTTASAGGFVIRGAGAGVSEERDALAPAGGSAGASSLVVVRV